VLTPVRIHRVVTAYEIDSPEIDEAIRLSEKYWSVGAMMEQAAILHTTYEIVAEKIQWLIQTPATIQR
jgi:uncharacterized OsmC-like protein